MLDDQTIRGALVQLAAQLPPGRAIEILIVGGAAGMLTRQLPESWTTSDVDMIHCHLPADRDLVLDAAGAITRRLSLPASWMNDFGGLFAWTLPDGWQSRRVLIGTFGRLHVYAVGRIDLITMKFLAHRTRDLEHLEQMRPTRAEVNAVLQALEALQSGALQEDQGKVQRARLVASDWQADL